MKWQEGVHQLASPPEASAVTLGSFDGLHIGHRHLIRETLKEAKPQDLTSVLFTFSPHPKLILEPEAPIVRLFDERDQVEQLGKMGLDLVIQEPFSLKLARLSPEDFLENYVLKPLNPKVLVLGYDFAVGAGRKGDSEFIQEFCSDRSIVVKVIEPLRWDGEVVSSSRIRDCLRAGEVEAANQMLARPFYLAGTVIEGMRRGHTLGIPTANINPQTGVLPRSGVYATRTGIAGQKWPSVTNIGVNPTFEKDPDRPLKVECHLLDWAGNIYGKELRIELISYLRDEKTFSGPEQLVAQIHKDIIAAKSVLS